MEPNFQPLLFHDFRGVGDISNHETNPARASVSAIIKVDQVAPICHQIFQRFAVAGVVPNTFRSVICTTGPIDSSTTFRAHETRSDEYFDICPVLHLHCARC